MSLEIQLWPVLLSHASSPGTSASRNSTSCFKLPSSSLHARSSRPWKAKKRMDDNRAITALWLSFIWFCLDSERADATFCLSFEAVRAAETAMQCRVLVAFKNFAKLFFEFWKPISRKVLNASLSWDVDGSGSFLSVAHTQMLQYTSLVCA